MKELFKFTLRLAPDLYTKLKERAEAEGRSLHGQVIYILTQAFK